MAIITDLNIHIENRKKREREANIQDAEVFSAELIDTVMDNDEKYVNKALAALMLESTHIHRFIQDEDNPDRPPAFDEVESKVPLRASESMIYNARAVYSTKSIVLEFDHVSCVAHLPEDVPLSSITNHIKNLEQEQMLNIEIRNNSALTKAFDNISVDKKVKDWLPKPFDNSFLEIILNNAEKVEVISLNANKQGIRKEAVTPQAIEENAKYDAFNLGANRNSKELFFTFRENSSTCLITLPDSFTLDNFDKIHDRLKEANSLNLEFMREHDPYLSVFKERANDPELLSILDEMEKRYSETRDDEKLEVPKEGNVYSPKFRK